MFLKILTHTWKNHSNSNAENANKKRNILVHLSKLLDRKTLSIMYSPFIRPSLEYENIISCNCTEQETELLESIQIRALRIITGGIICTHKHSLYEEISNESCSIAMCIYT